MKATPIPLFVFALVLLGLMALATFRLHATEPQVHPQFPTMQVGGERAADDSEHWAFGLTFGCCVIASLLACLWLGTNGKPQSGSLRGLVFAGGAFFAAAYFMMMLAYRDYVGDFGPSILGVFPRPATWMIFGVWFSPVFFIAVYSFGFHRWFEGDEDAEHEQPKGSVD